MIGEAKPSAYLVLTFAAAALGGALSSHFWPAGSSAAAAEVRSKHPKVVTAEKFVLVDSAGHERALMQVLANGMAGLAVLDTTGRNRAEIRVASDGSAGVAFFDKTGNKVAVVGEGVDGDAGLRIFAADGTQLAGLVVSAKRETALTLFDPKTGLARAGLGVANDGQPGLVLSDGAGRVRTELHVRADGKPGLALADENGKSIAGLP